MKIVYKLYKIKTAQNAVLSAIAGSSQNNEEGTKNGITYNNKKYYLVAVIGY